jgi:hypothetical protein
MNAHAPTPLPALFAPLRRRHPDVDVVLLPDRPVPSPDPVDDDAVADAVESVRTAALAIAGSAAADRVRLGPGSVPGTVVARARTRERRADGADAIATLRARLEGHGWQVRRLEGDVVRVVARRGTLLLHASFAPATGAYLVEISSGPLSVGDARARGLVRS